MQNLNDQLYTKHKDKPKGAWRSISTAECEKWGCNGCRRLNASGDCGMYRNKGLKRPIARLYESSDNIDWLYPDWLGSRDAREDQWKAYYIRRTNLEAGKKWRNMEKVSIVGMDDTFFGVTPPLHSNCRSITFDFPNVETFQVPTNRIRSAPVLREISTEAVINPGREERLERSIRIIREVQERCIQHLIDNLFNPEE